MNAVKLSLLGRLELAMISMNYSQIDVEKFEIMSDETHKIIGVKEREELIIVITRYIPRSGDRRGPRRDSRIQPEFLSEDVLEKLTVLLEGIKHGFIKIRA